MKLRVNCDLTISAVCHECGADLPCEVDSTSARAGDASLCVRVSLCEGCIDDARAEARREAE